MPAYRPNLPATEVDGCLRASLVELQHAQRNSVLWFSEILHRRLYLELGYSSIRQYAVAHLGFSRARVYYFLSLSRSLEVLPGLKGSVARGEVPWTKAREVIKVATPQTEAFWIEQARAVGRRELCSQIEETRIHQKRIRSGLSRQMPLPDSSGEAGGEGNPEPATMLQEGQEAGPDRHTASVGLAPIELRLRFLPEQLARYEALMEQLRRRGEHGSREDMLLTGLEAALRRATRTLDAGTSATARYQVVVRLCDRCGHAETPTGFGNRPLDLPALRAVLCDARLQRRGERNRATIPPRVRREVLARDGYRCRALGCESTAFLDVHHLLPREQGGDNNPQNLITLCAPCHRAIHMRSLALSEAPGAAGVK